jgi:hypothetical protein
MRARYSRPGVDFFYDTGNADNRKGVSLFEKLEGLIAT